MVDREYLSTPFWSIRSTRMYIAFVLMFTIFCAITMRDNMEMAVVCMVNTSSYSHDIGHKQRLNLFNTSRNDQECPKWSILNSKNAKEVHQGTFNWTLFKQSWLFSIVFYGSFSTILFSGYIADRYGPKIVIAIGLSGYMILNLLLPTAAKTDFYFLISIRFFMGILEGFVQPSLAAMISRWFPSSERSTAAAIYTSGFQLGSGFIAIMGSRLCLLPYLGGWPLIFYLSGCLGVVCLIIWLSITSNSPEESRIISKNEKVYLSIELSSDKPEDLDAKKFPVPWLKMLTSKAVLAVLISGFAINIETDLMMSFLPSYLRDILKVDVKTNGLITSIPFISLIITKNILSIMADRMKQSGCMSYTACSKIYQAYAAFGTAAIFLLIALFVDCTRPLLAIVLLVLYGVFYAGFVPGIYTSLLSIAPRFTGTLASLYGFTGMLGKIVSPTIVGVVNKTGSREEWATIYVISSILSIFAGLTFLIFGTAEVQQWSLCDEKNSKTKDPNT